MRAPRRVGVCNIVAAALGAVAALATFLGWTGVAGAVVVTLQPAQDAGVDTYLGNAGDSLNNYGAAQRLYVGDRDHIHRALLRFDLSSIDSSAVINSATLELYLDNYSGPGGSVAQISVHPVTRSWKEGTGDDDETGDGATWPHATGAGDYWAQPGGDYDPALGSQEDVPGTKNAWYSWDVTDMAAKWLEGQPNNGVLLKLVSENPSGNGMEREFVSNNRSDPTRLPRLILDITPGASKAAVDSARAEITPNSAASGGLQVYTYTIKTFYTAGQNSGANAVEVKLGSGFKLGLLTAVLLDGFPAPFTSTSDATTIRIGFPIKMNIARRIDVTFTATAPVVGASSSFDFPSTVDDASTAFPPIAATEGSANLNAGDANSWDVVVAPPPVLSIRIVPDSATVGADSSRNFDCDATTLFGSTPIEPSWSVVGSIGTIDSSGLFTATTAGAGRIVATYVSGLTFVDSAQVTVTPGAPASVTVTPDSVTVSADLTKQFSATVRDSDGNVVSSAPLWTVSGGIGTVNPSGLFTASIAGNGYVIAIAGSARDSSRVTVVPGVAASVVVTPDPVSVSADSTKQFSASVFDADGNAVAAAPVWSVLGGIGTVGGTGNFVATTSGIGFVRAVAGAARDSATVTVYAGQAVSLDVSPDSATVSADTTKLFNAIARDADGNIAAFAAKWTVRGGVGTVGAGLFSATTAGMGWVVASEPFGLDSTSAGFAEPERWQKSAASLSDSARVTVVPGALAQIVVSPASATLSADSSLTFTASGYDADGNAITVVLPVWSVSGGIGAIDASGKFDAQKVGSGGVIAKSALGTASDTAEVTVTMGAVKTVAITPSGGIASPGDTVQFDLTAFDKDGNATPIARPAVAWTTTDPAGSISSQGLYTAGTTLSPPTWEVKGTYGGLSASAAISVLSTGALTRIAIEDTLGAVVGGLAVTADQDGLALRATGYGPAGENLGPVSCTWNVVGSAAVAIVAAGPDVATSVEFRQTGSVRIRAAGPSGLVDSTGTITVGSGVLASLVVTPGPSTVSTDSTLQFAAAPKDEDGNASAGVTIAWSVLGGIGTVGATTGSFNPSTPGVGSVRAASSLGVAGDSPAVTVVAGALVTLDVSPASAIVPKGTTRQFAATTKDADGNVLSSAVSWVATGSVGSVDATGLFTGATGGAGKVIASAGAKADTAAVTVTETGSPRVLSVHAPRLTVTEGQSSIDLSLRFRNETGLALTDFAPTLRPRDPQGNDLSWSVTVAGSVAPDSIAAGAEGAITLTVGVGPALAPGAQVVLDASLLATSATGVAFYDSTADTTGAWVVQAAPRLADSQNSVWPRRVTRGESGVALLLGGWNEGGVSVTLDPAATRLSFGGSPGYASSLASALTLAADSSLGVFSFAGSVVPAGLAPGVYPLTLIASGTDANGKAYAETLTTTATNEVTVIPPYVTIVPVATAGGAARPGQTKRPLLGFDIENDYPDAKTLTSVALTNATAGPGTAAQRDAEFAAVVLYWDRDADGAVSAADSLLKSGVFSAGRVSLGGLALPIPSQDTLRFLAAIDVASVARDGDSLDIALAASADIAFAEAPTLDGVFPINPAGRLAVDGASASQFLVTPIAPRAAAAGESLVVALDVTIPANGYEPDTLRALAVAQQGTAIAGSDIARVRLARRTATSGGAFAAASGGAIAAAALADSAIGDLVWTGARWVRSGMSLPIPSSGLRLLVLVDVASNAALGRTISLALPAGEGAASVASGNDGPLDAAVGAGGTLTVSSPDRILVSPIAVATASLEQGAAEVPLFAITLSNGYAAARSLTRLRLSADGALSDPVRLDALLSSVTLRLDADRDGDRDAADALLKTAAVSNGIVDFSVLSVSIPSQGTVGLLVTGAVSPAARDSDLFRLSVAAVPDLSFSVASAVAGSFPVESAPLLPVSGMTRATIANPGAPPRALVPGEEDVLILDVTIPPNGYEPDTLRSIRIENAGTAQNGTDLLEICLYADGGDGIFDDGVIFAPSGGTGDDTLIGTLSYAGSGWLLEGLSVPLPLGGVRLFGSLDVAASPTDSATVVARIPVGGIAVESANDGPVDGAVENAFALTISTSPLVVAVGPERPEASVGQTLAMRLVMRNVGDRTITGIGPSLAAEFGENSVTILSGPTPDSLELFPGAGGEFEWTLRADSVGSVAFTGAARGHDAETGEGISSTPILSRPLTIVNPPAEVSLFAANLAPPTIARNDTLGVVPLSLTFTANGALPFAAAEVRAIRISIDDGEGSPIAAADVLDSLTLREGSMVFHSTGSFGSGASVELELQDPVMVSPGNPVTVAIGLDVRDDTVVPAFRLVIDAAAAVDVADANSGAPVPLLLSEGAFPIESGTMLVVETPSELELTVEEVSPFLAAVNRGQEGIRAARLRFRAIGDPSVASDVRVVDVSFSVVDSAGAPAEPALLSRASLAGDPIVFGEIVAPALEAGAIRIALTTPLLLPVSTEVVADVLIGISGLTAQRHLRLAIDAARLPTARDAATGAPIPVRLVQPFAGSLVRIESRPPALRVSPRVLPGRAAYPGTAAVPMIRAQIRHAGAAGDAGILVGSLTVRVTDDLGNPEGAGTRLFSLTAVERGVAIGSINVAENASPTATVAFAQPIVLSPGDSTEVELRATVLAAATPGKVRAWIDPVGLPARAANEGVAVELVTDGAPFPLGSAILSVLAPPASPIASFADRTPATVARGAAGVPLGTLRITNPQGIDAGPIELEALRLRVEDNRGGSFDVAGQLAATRARIAGGEATGVSEDPAIVAFEPPRSIAPGETLVLEIEGDIAPAPAATAFRIVLADTAVAIARPGDGIAAPTVRAAPGESFPFATALVGIAEPKFAASLSNYPNPFAAGREATRFVFYLDEAAEIDLDVFTPLGEPVATIARGLRAAAGMIEPLAWDGRNADGEPVLSGVYLAEVRVRYASGRAESILRKVAVLR